MYLDEYLRNKIYFFIDRIKGKKINNLIKKIDIKLNYSNEVKIQLIEDDLKNLLFEVNKFVPYYKNNKFLDFKNLPIITKNIISQNVREYISSKYTKDEVVVVRTSGSYGTPLDYLLTKEKKQNQLAEVIYFGRKNNYDVGIRHGYFRSNPHKTKFKFWLQNETFFASKNLNQNFLKKGVLNLKKNKIKTLIGFPSAISYLAKYSLDQGYTYKDFKVNGVITSSENLTKYQRDVIREAFNCEVHSRYSTEELGVLANEYNEDSGFVINTANYIIEVLALDSDKSVNIGEIGRVVVTDLNSFAMPLIRYETGDLAKVKKFLCVDKGWVESLESLSGRTIQVLYSTKDEALYPLYLDTIMEKYTCFAQHQLIQYDRCNFLIKLVKNSNFCSSKFNLDTFKTQFFEWLGTDAKLKVEFVEDIEKLPSGKRPYIINNYKKFDV